MLLQVKIKLTSNLLGDRKDNTKIRRLRKEKGNILLDRKRWFWAVREAIKSMNMTCDAESIFASCEFESPSIHLYNRSYRDNKGALRREMFECLRENTVITFDVVLPTEPPPDSNGKQMATVDEFRLILVYVGKYLGISQFGNKFGFGRFSVIAVDRIHEISV